MPLLELKRKLKLSDLEVGKLFDEDELIILRQASGMVTMATIRREDDKIRRYMYNLRVKGQQVVSVNNNGYGDIEKEDKAYLRYNNMLKGAGK